MTPQSQPMIVDAPWCIPTDGSTVICQGGDPTKPGEIILVVRGPVGTKQSYSHDFLGDHAAFIVEAVNSHATLLNNVEVMKRHMTGAADEIASLRAKVDELTVALRQVRNCPDNCDECRRVVQKALALNSQERGSQC